MSNEISPEKKNIYFKAVKNVFKSYIRKASAKEYVESWMASQSQIQKKEREQRVKKEGINRKNSTSILQYTFVTGKSYIPTFDELKEEKPQEQKTSRPFYRTKKKRLKLYEKFLESKLLRDSKVEEEKNKKIIEDYNSICNPQINSKSLMLVSKKKELMIPIHKRLNEIRISHEEKLQRIRDDICREEEKKKEDHDKLVRSWVKHKRYSSTTEMNFDEWLNKNENWENERKEKLSLRRSESANCLYEREEENTFAPRINKKSLRILKKKQKLSNENTARDNCVSERLYHTFFVYKDRLKELKSKYAPTFKPKIITDYEKRRQKEFSASYNF